MCKGIIILGQISINDPDHKTNWNDSFTNWTDPVLKYNSLTWWFHCSQAECVISLWEVKICKWIVICVKSMNDPLHKTNNSNKCNWFSSVTHWLNSVTVLNTDWFYPSHKAIITLHKTCKCYTQVIWTILRSVYAAFTQILKTENVILCNWWKRVQPFEISFFVFHRRNNVRCGTTWGWLSQFSFLSELIHIQHDLSLSFFSFLIVLPLFSQCGHECVQNKVC